MTFAESIKFWLERDHRVIDSWKSRDTESECCYLACNRGTILKVLRTFDGGKTCKEDIFFGSDIDVFKKAGLL